MRDGPIRVLLVEDSAAARALLAMLLAEEPDIEVVGLAADGPEGVSLAGTTRPDVVLMDLHMPTMDGFQATRQIMENHPTRIVMITAGFNPDDVRTSMRSLEAGALAVLEKPVGFDHPEHEASLGRLLETIRLMSEVTVVRRWSARSLQPPAPLPAPPPRPGRRARMVVIGTSTGGPRVLARILRDLPSGFAAPICVVQHISPGFLAGMVGWLDDECSLEVRIADDGLAPQPGTVYFAPDDRQLGFAATGALRIGDETAPSGFRPSVSHLFLSAAEVWERAAVGVLLTGMGRDGADGMLRLHRAGAPTIAQDPATCVVDGMPAAAIAAGAATYVLPPEGIAGQLCKLVALLEGSDGGR